MKIIIMQTTAKFIDKDPHSSHIREDFIQEWNKGEKKIIDGIGYSILNN